MPLHIEVITPERKVYEDDVDMVIAPGSEGYLGILPHHAPLLTGLGPGEFRVKKGGTEQVLAVFGGFMDVRGDRVVVLTESAEHAEEIEASARFSSKEAEPSHRPRADALRPVSSKDPGPPKNPVLRCPVSARRLKINLEL